MTFRKADAQLIAMVLNFTFADLVGFFAYTALLYAGAPLAVLAVGLLLVPACRRIALLRRTAWGLLALVGLLSAGAVPMLSEIWSEHEHQVIFARDTHHLTAPQVLSGILFPAGSTVHVNSYVGRVEFGSVPVPTTIAGQMLVGDFRLEWQDGGDYTISAGTLAVPTVIHGIPCSWGALIAQENTTRCILDRDFNFAGHMMARGAGIEIYRPAPDEPAVLRWGTIAQPELLYDVVWPAGTVIGGRITLSPRRMAHGDGSQGSFQMCIAKGTTLPLAGAVLHGLMALTIDGGRRLLSRVCSILPSEPVDLDGYVQVGTTRYASGNRATRTSAWSWNDPVEP